MEGILNILKPPGMTSQDVVSYIKRLLKVNKAGHTGTLDPGAAGVLPVCIGKATKVSDYLLNDKKSYRVEMMLGLKSDTLDKYGNVEHLEEPDIKEEEIRNIFDRFKGKIIQTPPMFSAVKQGGRPLYELARQGIVVERKTREVHIYELNILKISGGTVLFDVTCSKGTYIRSLCSDIGNALGSDAIMTFLLRTKTGPFDIESAITFNELNTVINSNGISNILYPLDSALVEYGRVYVNEDTAKKVMNGVGFYFSTIDSSEFRDYNDKLLIYNSSNEFMAIGKRNEKGDFVKIDKVFA